MVDIIQTPERETVVERNGNGAGALVFAVLLIGLIVLAFLYFGGRLDNSQQTPVQNNTTNTNVPDNTAPTDTTQPSTTTPTTESATQP